LHLPFQDVSPTDAVVEDGTISDRVIPLGSKQMDIPFRITVRRAVPTDREAVAPVLTLFTRIISTLSTLCTRIFSVRNSN
jgi:hypothetical protein